MTTPTPQRPALEVADVLRTHGAAFLAIQGAQLSRDQQRAVKELALCRTAALGGHTEQCAGCGVQRISYNSCRNRHCPKCQAGTRAAWLQREAQALLPVDYYHVVFTLPAALGPLALQNRRVLYDLLLRTAWETVRELASDPHYLGATVGLLAVLHTWGQTLCHHPHVHCVATGGGLACDVNGRLDPQAWREALESAAPVGLCDWHPRTAALLVAGESRRQPSNRVRGGGGRPVERTHLLEPRPTRGCAKNRVS